MTDIISWGLGEINNASILMSGGNLVIIGMIPILLTAMFLWYARASLPVSALIVFVELGVLSVSLNPSGDPTLGGTNDIGIIAMMFLLVVAMGGFIIYHTLFKRSQMG